MSQSHLQLKRGGVEQKDVTVANAEELVRMLGGNRVINRVMTVNVMGSLIALVLHICSLVMIKAIFFFEIIFLFFEKN